MFIVFPVASTCTKQAFNVGMNFFGPFSKIKKKPKYFSRGWGYDCMVLSGWPTMILPKKLQKINLFVVLKRQSSLANFFL